MTSPMTADQIRLRFLAYFERQGHAVQPSGPLVPPDDPTLLFTDAGMVQFKRAFLGLEQPSFGARATTSQKCVRVGGKHNDLEQVGHSSRHHTFLEMLGNFSFGDYSKRDAIRFAWQFIAEELKIPKADVRVTVDRTDEEIRGLWRDVAGLADSHIYGMPESDMVWQMADTGPCGPGTEIYVDLAHLARDWTFPAGATGEWTDVDRLEFSEAAFTEGVEAGRFLEIWNLVFLQSSRRADGSVHPLPIPGVDTGAGLERIAAVVQGTRDSYKTDLFVPLIKAAEDLVGVRYEQALAGTAPASVSGRPVEAASFRILVDHARAAAFLLADGVVPAGDGRGYVLRRILRRAVRHAWLLGRKEPTVVHVVQAVIDTMGAAYPELQLRAPHLIDTTRAEEERFLETLDAGMARFDELAPARATTIGSLEVRGTISGEDAFQLYDSFGFAIDLTVLMARERGFTVDIGGFDRARDLHRAKSKGDGRAISVSTDTLADLTQWEFVDEGDRTVSPPHVRFVGYDQLEAETHVAAWRDLGQGATALILNERPFYAESGGQVADQGEVIGEGWRLDVTDVQHVGAHVAVIGQLEGDFCWGPVIARVSQQTRQGTERNHTAAHLLHMALRQILGDRVHHSGSVVGPDRLRFDFSHGAPLTAGELLEVEGLVNREIARAVPVSSAERSYTSAITNGAIPFYNEKYGDEVRVVTVPGFSAELCNGTHVHNTSEILLFKIVSDTGVGDGTRRIEAVTARAAYARTLLFEHSVDRIADAVHAAPDPATLASRVDQLVAERHVLEQRLSDALAQLAQVRARDDGSTHPHVAASIEIASVREVSGGPAD